MKVYVILPVFNRTPSESGDLPATAYVHERLADDALGYGYSERGQPLRCIVHATHWKFAISTTAELSNEVLNLAIAILADFFGEAVPIDDARASLHPDARHAVPLHYWFARDLLTNATPNQPVTLHGSTIQTWVDARGVAAA